MFRDAITRFGLNRLHLQLRRAAGENVEHLFRATLAEKFAAIYNNRVWLNNRLSGSLSGLGSELVNTEGIRGGLPRTLAELNTQTLLDLGCGDFLWMKETDLGCRYIGIDVVEEVISANVRLHGTDKRRFLTLDGTTQVLPKADTVLCREVLFHLSFLDIAKMLANIKRSHAVFLIATNDPGLRHNADILSGDFRLLNLHKAPFCFPKPHMSFPDDRLSPGRTLSVWETCTLDVR